MSSNWLLYGNNLSKIRQMTFLLSQGCPFQHRADHQQRGQRSPTEPLRRRPRRRSSLRSRRRLLRDDGPGTQGRTHHRQGRRDHQTAPGAIWSQNCHHRGERCLSSIHQTVKSRIMSHSVNEYAKTQPKSNNIVEAKDQKHDNV